jgi:hypothetical protein
VNVSERESRTPFGVPAVACGLPVIVAGEGEGEGEVDVDVEGAVLTSREVVARPARRCSEADHGDGAAATGATTVLALLAAAESLAGRNLDCVDGCVLVACIDEGTDDRALSVEAVVFKASIGKRSSFERSSFERSSFERSIPACSSGFWLGWLASELEVFDDAATGSAMAAAGASDADPERIGVLETDSPMKSIVNQPTQSSAASDNPE